MAGQVTDAEGLQNLAYVYMAAFAMVLILQVQTKIGTPQTCCWQ